MSADTIRLFLNPTAGRGRAGKRKARILELLDEAGLSVECRESRSVSDLESLVRQAVDSGTTRIVVAGGDGSVHEAVNGIMRSASTASLGIIPTGTGNDFAKACDIPLNWEHATRLLADRIKAEGPLRQIDVGCCNGRYFANGAGVGFDAKVSHIARSMRLPVGDLVYLLAIFRAMIDGIATPELTITTDDFHFEGPVTLAAVSNGPWIGGVFHIAPTADNSDHTMELLIAKPVTRRRILSLLPKLMSGKHLGEAEIVHQPVTALSIKAEQAMPWHLDGEVQPLQSAFEISLSAGALDLL